MTDEREDRRQRIARLAYGLDMAVDWVLTLQDDIAELKGDIVTLAGVRDDLIAACDSGLRELLSRGVETIEPQRIYGVVSAIHASRAHPVCEQMRLALAEAKARDDQETPTTEGERQA